MSRQRNGNPALGAEPFGSRTRRRRSPAGRLGPADGVRLLVAALALLASVSTGWCGEETFPGKSWTEAPSPEDLGWSPAGLEKVGAYLQSVGSAGAMIVEHGVVVASWGTIDHPYNVASLRKSLLSALIGIAVGRGQLDPEATLEELGIDDLPPSLTPEEKRARVVDLLTARSGVYHPSAYEPGGMKKRRPPRGSHPPGEFWFYNNWDFNTLGTIYERATGASIFAAFAAEIAGPTGMEDYDPEAGRYVRQNMSEHAAYLFRMSARDLARFGLLYLRRGRWEERSLVPESWVVASTSSGAPTWRGSYGYMWWIATEGRHYKNVLLPPGTFIGRGAGGHHLVVIPEWDLVVVHQGETDHPAPGNWVGEDEVDQFLNLVLEAKPEPDP